MCVPGCVGVLCVLCVCVCVCVRGGGGGGGGGGAGALLLNAALGEARNPCG